MSIATGSHAAFFYGTLMHPKILRRVIGHEGDRLEICPAVLMDHTRHHVKHADYPAVLPYEKSKELFEHELSREEKSVRGTLVVGLTNKDIHFLDVFEGNEYIRSKVRVHRLGLLLPLSSSGNHSAESSVVPSTPPTLPASEDLAAPVEAETYIWCRPTSHVESKLWSYETFVKENAYKWIGEKASIENEDYLEVDRRRGMNGNIIRVAEA